MSNREALTAETATVGQTVYRGKGKAPLRIIKVWQNGYTGSQPGVLLVSTVKASTPDRPGLTSTVQAARYFTVEVSA